MHRKCLGWHFEGPGRTSPNVKLSKRSVPTSNFQSGRKDFDHAKYDELFKVVEKEILQLRVILQSIEARERERTWLRGKVLGESLGFKNGFVLGWFVVGAWCLLLVQQ